MRRLWILLGLACALSGRAGFYLHNISAVQLTYKLNRPVEGVYWGDIAAGAYTYVTATDSCVVDVWLHFGSGFVYSMTAVITESAVNDINNVAPVTTPPTWTVTRSYTNNSIFSESVRFRIPAQGGHSEISEIREVPPGATQVFVITTDYEWTGGEMQVFMGALTAVPPGSPEGTTHTPGWYGGTVGIATTTPDGTPGTTGVTGSNGGPNIYAPGNTSPTQGTQASPANPAPSTAGDSDAKQDARHAALRTLLVGISDKQKDRDAAQLQAGLKALDKLDGLGGALTGLRKDMSDGNLTTHTATTAQIGGINLVPMRTALGGFVPVPSIGAASAPEIVVDLTPLHSDLGSLNVDFAEVHIAGWVTALRAFCLVMVTVQFVLLSLNLLGKVGNV